MTKQLFKKIPLQTELVSSIEMKQANDTHKAIVKKIF